MLICFDWDGTIADSMDLCVAEVRAALLALNLPDLPNERLRQCNGPTFEETIPLLGIPESLGERYMQERHAAEMRLLPTVSRLYPGILELLRELHGKADLAVVSNGLGEYIEKSQQVFGTTGLFSHVMACRSGYTKTDNLRELLDTVNPDRAVMIGDRIGDISAGKRCGITAIAAGYGYGNDAEYSQADIWVHSVAELRDVLLDMLHK